jgi:hypothetical protein
MQEVSKVITLSFPEYTKIVYKSTTKSIYDPLYAIYEGNHQVKEAKENLIIRQYGLFKMKDDEDIETLFLRFQTPVYVMQVLNKSYTTSDHVKKIMRSLPVRWRP